MPYLLLAVADAARFIALLSALCDVFSASPALLSRQTGLRASSDTEPLLVLAGDGAFVKTILDLKVMIEKDEHSIMTILDYEVS
jgi:hypothetical protein